MAKLTQEELNKIVEAHGKWYWSNGKEGKSANLEGANLEGANLEGADLEGANLEGAFLEGAFLEGANLEGANLEGAVLEGAVLEGANLEGANLEGANLEGAVLEGANLEGAFLEGANLPNGVYQIVGCGSANRCTTYDSINDRVICGCWNDGEGNRLESFKKRIEDIYGENGENPNSIYYAEYQAAIKFFENVKELKE